MILSKISHCHHHHHCFSSLPSNTLFLATFVRESAIQKAEILVTHQSSERCRWWLKTSLLAALQKNTTRRLLSTTSWISWSASSIRSMIAKVNRRFLERRKFFPASRRRIGGGSRCTRSMPFYGRENVVRQCDGHGITRITVIDPYTKIRRPIRCVTIKRSKLVKRFARVELNKREESERRNRDIYADYKLSSLN